MDKLEPIVIYKWRIIAELDYNNWILKSVIVKASTPQKAKIIAKRYLKNKYNYKKILIIKIEKIKEDY